MAALCLLACRASSAPPASFEGKVVGVADGDTITVLHDNKPERIRLHGVDTPEKAQPFGSRAKQLTSRLVFGKQVTVKVKTRDRYGRTVGEVLVGGRSLNEALVQAGLAWWYKRYAPRAKMLAFLEQQARKARRGLWAQPSPTAPWDYRHSRRGYHGNVKSRVFHASWCQHYNCKQCTARFRSAAAARKAGYRPHRACVKR